MDKTLYEQSIDAQDRDYIFKNSDLIYVNDDNNSAYNSGRVQFDLASITNSNSFVSFKESELHIPLVMTVSGVNLNPVTAQDQLFMATLKNNLTLINSIDIQLNNTSIVNMTQNSGMYCNYKILSSYSINKYESEWDLYGFHKDNGMFYNNSIQQAI